MILRTPWLLALLVPLSACGSSVAGPGPVDASSETSVTDTGTVTPRTDTGVGSIDTGRVIPPLDSGSPPQDTGTVAVDGPVGDAGTRFSFFVTSLRALLELSGNPQGFGGDLRFGESGPGAGLRGADRLCSVIAERSMPGRGAMPWRAFLSATNDGTGRQVHAIHRIGQGPWYDRLGRLFANNLTELMNTRPVNAHPAILNDFPNEDGVPNHRPDPSMGNVDNHDMLTGTNAAGMLYSMTATCLDWTSARGDRSTEGRPRVGHSWPRGGGGGPGGMGGSGAHWMSSLDEAGCAPGVSLIEMGGPILSMPTVGSGGGYGGFYCFSLVP